MVADFETFILWTLQPVAEILAFRIGELRGISRWRSRLESIGLEDKLLDQTMEDAGMVLLQVERVLRIVSDTTAQVLEHFSVNVSFFLN